MRIFCAQKGLSFDQLQTTIASIRSLQGPRWTVIPQLQDNKKRKLCHYFMVTTVEVQFVQGRYSKMYELEEKKTYYYI